MEVVPQGLRIQADSDLLEQALINLIRNARDALATSGDKMISVRGLVNSRNRIEISVSDTGPGIPADVSEKIFVPFFTTKPEGSGVGLALARQVMTAHGGFVRLAASGDGGAAFSLTF